MSEKKKVVVTMDVDDIAKIKASGEEIGVFTVATMARMILKQWIDTKDGSKAA